MSYFPDIKISPSISNYSKIKITPNQKIFNLKLEENTEKIPCLNMFSNDNFKEGSIILNSFCLLNFLQLSEKSFEIIFAYNSDNLFCAEIISFMKKIDSRIDQNIYNKSHWGIKFSFPDLISKEKFILQFFKIKLKQIKFPEFGSKNLTKEHEYRNYLKLYSEYKKILNEIESLNLKTKSTLKRNPEFVNFEEKFSEKLSKSNLSEFNSSKSDSNNNSTQFIKKTQICSEKIKTLIQHIEHLEEEIVKLKNEEQILWPKYGELFLEDVYSYYDIEDLKLQIEEIKEMLEQEKIFLNENDNENYLGQIKSFNMDSFKEDATQLFENEPHEIVFGKNDSKKTVKKEVNCFKESNFINFRSCYRSKRYSNST